MPELLRAIEDQTLQPVEVVIADGRSTDGSRLWVRGAMRSRPWLRLVDNPTQVIPDGMNRAVEATSADIVARMDAHAWYAPDYLEHLVDVLENHREVAGAGGAMGTTGSGPWGSAIASVLRRPWGLGGAPHRGRGVAGPVDHTFCTAYRRSAVLAVGGWDRRLLANEDVELDFRVAATEGPIWLVPRACSIWRTRETPVALARQMWRYGYYRARTAHLHPRTLKVRHLAPVVLVTGIPVLALLRPRWGARVAVSYLVSAAGMGALGARRDRACAIQGGVIVPIVHVAWGAGMVVGLIRHARARSAPGLAAIGYP